MVDDLRRPPLWRVRTSPDKRLVAGVLTFVVVVAVGTALAWSAAALLARIGAPTWLATAPWWSSMVVMVLVVVGRRMPADLTNEDGQGWIEYVVRTVLIGHGEERDRPLRAAAAVVFGAPVGWFVVFVSALSLVGLFDA